MPKKPLKPENRKAFINSINLGSVSKKYYKEIEKELKTNIAAGAQKALDKLGKPDEFSIRDINTEKFIRSRKLGEKIARDLQDFSVQLANGIDKVTQQALVSVFDKALAQGTGLQGIKSGLKQTFTGMTEWRARMIARTETAFALNYGQVTGYRKGGIEYVQVSDGDKDDTDAECMIVNGMIISLDLAEQYPIAHPNCVRSFLPLPSETVDPDEVQDEAFLRAVTAGTERDAEEEEEVEKGGSGSGNFDHEGRPGEVGGSGSGGGGKSPKQHLTKILELSKQGMKPGAIAAKLGLNKNSVQVTIWKNKKSQAAIDKNLQTAQTATENKYDAQQQAAQAASQAAAPAPPPPAAPAPAAAATIGPTVQPNIMNLPDGTYIHSVSGNVWVKDPNGKWFLYDDNEDVVTNPTDPPKGLTWQEKTAANSPNLNAKNAGKYALFDANGMQVSPPMEKDKMADAVTAMNYGQGPVQPVAAPTPTPAPATPKASTTAAQSVSGAMTKAGWPIGDGVDRKMSGKYEKEVFNHYNKWATSVSASVESDIDDYTGSGNGPMNRYLRGLDDGSEHIVKQAENINKAISNAPPPPPPELVWRGGDAKGDKDFVKKLGVGGIVRLSGIQSTSVSPSFAKGWGSADYILEIQPKSGAYVQKISSHKSEYEFLIPHDQSYKVMGITEVKLNGVKTKVLQLKML